MSWKTDRPQAYTPTKIKLRSVNNMQIERARFVQNRQYLISQFRCIRYQMGEWLSKLLIMLLEICMPAGIVRMSRNQAAGFRFQSSVAAHMIVVRVSVQNEA